MAADLHIHAMVGVTEDDLSCFFSSHIGSRWEDLGNTCEHWCQHRRAVESSPSIWIGEVSWLKAAFTGSAEYIPEPVGAVQDLVGEHMPVLDEAFRAQLLGVISTPNNRARRYRTTTDASVVEWMDEHMGTRLFTVSW